MKGICAAQRFDDSIALVSPGDEIATHYRYASSLPKACVHPLATPAGHVLSGFEMSDHVWHRGLWFTIKYVNGTNFWEEGDEPHGRHVGRGEPTLELIDTSRARIRHELEWTSEATGVVITESRVLEFCELGSGIRCLDWKSTIVPQVDVLLDRTPFTTWGGYGGLILRASREIHEARFIVPDGSTREQLTGESHEWVALEGLMDGGVDQRVSFAMVDHPANPRSPSPWYGRVGSVVYLNAAFLFHEPLSVTAGQPLTFAYRMLYRDGLWNTDEIARIAAEYRNGR